MGVKVLFIDRDGTLIEEPEDFQVDSVEKVRLVRGVIPALLELAQHGYRFVIVSNQDGLGTTSLPQEEFAAAHDHTLQLFTSQGVTFDEIFICSHMPADSCDCRKPRTGLLTEKQDSDYYRFFLANWDHIRLEVRPPTDGIVDAESSADQFEVRVNPTSLRRPRNSPGEPDAAW